MSEITFEFLEPNIPLWVNGFAISANILNLIYNFPQMWRTFKRKSTRDISGWFLLLRVISSILWVVYSIAISNGQLIIANSVTLIASIFVGYYKAKELTQDCCGHKLEEITIDKNQDELNSFKSDQNEPVAHSLGLPTLGLSIKDDIFNGEVPPPHILEIKKYSNNVNNVNNANKQKKYMHSSVSVAALNKN